MEALRCMSGKVLKHPNEWRRMDSEIVAKHLSGYHASASIECRDGLQVENPDSKARRYLTYMRNALRIPSNVYTGEAAIHPQFTIYRSQAVLRTNRRRTRA